MGVSTSKCLLNYNFLLKRRKFWVTFLLLISFFFLICPFLMKLPRSCPPLLQFFDQHCQTISLLKIYKIQSYSRLVHKFQQLSFSPCHVTCTAIILPSLSLKICRASNLCFIYKTTPLFLLPSEDINSFPSFLLTKILFSSYVSLL